MSELGQQVIDAMCQRGYLVRTHQAYVAAVAGLARHYGCSPVSLSAEEVKAYFEYLAVKRSLSGSTCREQVHGVRFFYEQVLGRRDFDLSVPLPKQAQRIAQLFTRAELARILGAPHNLKHRLLLATCYGCGLRVSELVAIRVRRDIDGERRLLRVDQGKGGKDRLIPIGHTLLEALRDYWRRFRPERWLFAQCHPSRAALQRKHLPESVSARQGPHRHREGRRHPRFAATPRPPISCNRGRCRRCNTTWVTPAFAPRSYLHWIPDYRQGQGEHDLMAQLPSRGRWIMAEPRRLATVLANSLDDYCPHHRLKPRQWQVWHHLLACRTPKRWGRRA